MAAARATAAILHRRALNRATLARQMLLERAALDPVEAVKRLVGLQAQTTHSWYLTLWSRLCDFDPIATGRLLEERRLLRMTLMRATIHLVADDDAPILRRFSQPAIERLLRGTFGRQLGGVEMDELAGMVRSAVADGARTLPELTDVVAARWPGMDRFALSQAVKGYAPLIHAPPRGVWGRSGAVRLADLEAWLGRAVPETVDPGPIILRYLGAYGPASAMDAQTWSGLTRLGEIFERLRPDLLTFRDADGRELFDLPDAPRPDPDTPAPPRLLADYDNLLLSHADRTRFVGEVERAALTYVSGPIPGAILVDGTVAGRWFPPRADGNMTLTVELLQPVSPDDEAALRREAEGAARFLMGSEGSTPSVVVSQVA
jgi:hypothetical protein